MALRLGRPQDAGVVARKLGDIGCAPYARAGTDAGRLPWVAYDESLAHLPEARWADRARGDAPVVLRTPHVPALVEAVAAGHGIGVLPCWLADADPRLARLTAEVPVRREAWLVVHEGLRRHRRVRAVADWMTDLFAAERARLAGGD